MCHSNLSPYNQPRHALHKATNHSFFCDFDKEWFKGENLVNYYWNISLKKGIAPKTMRGAKSKERDKSSDCPRNLGYLVLMSERKKENGKAPNFLRKRFWFSRREEQRRMSESSMQPRIA